VRENPTHCALDLDHTAVAIEQYLDWRRQGLSHRQMLAAVNFRPTHRLALTAGLVIDVLIATHRALMEGGA
jgi:hypothetical protein